MMRPLTRLRSKVNEPCSLPSPRGIVIIDALDGGIQAS